MAIAKVGSTGSSAGAINYVLSENKDITKQPEILAGSFGTMAEIKKEFDLYNKLNCRVKNQATHISVSFALSEKVKTEKKIEFAEKLLEKLDFKNVPYLVVEHHDKEYEHFHIIAGRIRDDGTTVKEWKMAERAIEATKELEKELGLKQVEYTKSGDRRIKSNEFKQMERTNELSVMVEAKFVIDEILKDEPTVRDFVETLHQSGFDVRPNISEKTGKMNGFSYKKDEIKFKSSTIAKNYSWKNLQKSGLKYDQTRDAEYLIGVKNEFTQKLNIEGRGDRAIETAKPAIDPTESITDRTQSNASRPESNLEKVQSILRQELNGDYQKVQHRDTEHSNISEGDGTNQIEFIEIINGPSGEFVEEKLHQERYNSFGLRDARTGNKSNREESSRIGKSKNEPLESETIANEKKVNSEPKRELEKEDEHVNKIHRDYSRGRSR